MHCPECLTRIEDTHSVCPCCGSARHTSLLCVCGLSPAPRSSTLASTLEVSLSRQTPFVGRAQEIGQIRAFLDSVQAGAPRLICLTGAPGMGKTRLVLESLKIQGRFQKVFIWTCFPHLERLPYGPIIHWFQNTIQLDAWASPEQIEKKLGEFICDVPALTTDDMPALRALLGYAPYRSDSLPRDHEGARLVLHELIANLIDFFAESRPACLVLDNAQHLDSATLGALEQLFANPVKTTQAVILIGETVNLPDSFPVQPSRIRVNPLNEEERSQLFRELAPSAEFLPELREHVLSQSHGSPTFLKELTLLVEMEIERNQHLPGPELQANIIEILPVSYPELIHRRLKLLDNRSNATLKLASVLGLDCTLGLAESIQKIQDDIQSENLFHEARHILRDQYRYNGCEHDSVVSRLLNSTYQRLNKSERQSLHLQIAHAVEQTVSHDSSANLERLAYHYKAAQQTEKALYYRMKAADRQVRIGEIDEAIHSYQEALDMMDELPPSPVSQIRMARVMLMLGNLMRWKGKGCEAREFFHSAKDLAANTHNRHLLLRINSELAALDLGSGTLREAEKTFHELEFEAQCLHVPKILCHVMLIRATWLYNRSGFDEALSAFHKVAELCRTHHFEDFEAEALNLAGLIHMEWCQYPEAIRSIESALAIRLRAQDPIGEISSRINLAICQENRGEVGPALSNYQHALTKARSVGFKQGECYAALNLANLQRRLGLYAASHEHASHAYQVARKLKEPLALIDAAINLALSCSDLGEYEHSQERLVEALDMALQQETPIRSARARIHLIDLARELGKSDKRLVEELDDIIRQSEIDHNPNLAILALKTRGRVQRALQELPPKASVDSFRLALIWSQQMNKLIDEQVILQELLQCPTIFPKIDQEAQKWNQRLQRINERINQNREAHSKYQQEQQSDPQAG